MQISRIFSSVEFVLGLVFLIAGIAAHVVSHAADPRLLLLAPFGGGLILSDTVCRIGKRAVGRVSVRTDGTK